MQLIFLTILLVTGSALANIENTNINDETISNLADKLPADLADKLPAEVPNIEDAQKLLKEKCFKLTGNDEAYNKATVAKEALELCVKGLVNVTELQEEIENAKPTGDLDSVFGKYCRKTPMVIKCVKDFLNTVDPCLEQKEKDNKKIVMNMTESLIDFLCYKDGDRIAMFIAEGGVECIQEKQEALQHCANETIGSKIPSEMPDVNSLPLLVIEKEQCDDLNSLQVCMVSKLEECSEPTPANIIDALFKFIKKVTPCGKLTTSAKKIHSNKNNDASIVAISSFFMIVSTLFVRYF